MRLIPSLIICCWTVFAAPPVGKALTQAHAHNDYEHTRPLLDALEQGFTSVEADIHLVNGQLLVAHDSDKVDPRKTLSGLYLDPVRKLLSDKERIFESGETLTLLIDLKTSAEPTYAALRKLLEQYSGMLTEFDGEKIETNAVTVILSGNRPRETLMEEKKRHAAFDGRLTDLGKELPVSFMPLVSDNWNSHFTWKGEGEMQEVERRKLREIVGRAHAEKRRIRFWAIPDKEAAWTEMRAAGVDLINTDDLSGLARFLRN